MDDYYEKYVPHCIRCGSRNVKCIEVSRGLTGYDWDMECKECGQTFVEIGMPCHINYFLEKEKNHGTECLCNEPR